MSDVVDIFRSSPQSPKDPYVSATETVTIPLPPPHFTEVRHNNHPEGGGDYLSPAGRCGNTADHDRQTYGWDYGPQVGCGKPLGEREAIRKLSGHWLHDACAVESLRKAAPDAAWIMLAEHLARRPGDFKVTETRAIVNAVVRIAARGGAR